VLHLAVSGGVVQLDEPVRIRPLELRHRSRDRHALRVIEDGKRMMRNEGAAEHAESDDDDERPLCATKGHGTRLLESG